VIDKGVDRDTDGYSGFAATQLASDLRVHGVKRVFVCGLATDYCVRATALDAHAAGFATVVVADASAAVDVQPGDEARALDELRRAGIDVVQSGDITGTARVRI
jgi:nicotinamidase/pyrazinamidase